MTPKQNRLLLFVYLWYATFCIDNKLFGVIFQQAEGFTTSPIYRRNLVPKGVPTKNVNHNSFVEIQKQNTGSCTDKNDQEIEFWRCYAWKRRSKKVEIPTYEVKSLNDLNEYFEDKEKRFRKKKSKDSDEDDIDYDLLLKSLSVKGDTQIIGSSDHSDVVHPVLQLLHERRRTKSPLTPVGEKREDGHKVALVVEGGGMRGCLTAGMVSAIYYLGLEDCFDVIYGSSAGSIIGSYFNTRQLPWFGPEIYYDSLTTAGKKFIDTKRLVRAVGLGLLDPRLLKDVVFRRNNGKPVLNLDFLLKETVQEKKPLHWDTFLKMQKVQPVKVVASGLHSNTSVVMSMENGAFNNLHELTRCMHSACLLPGVAGPIMNLNLDRKNIDNDGTDAGEEEVISVARNNYSGKTKLEPFADTLIFEPLPYRSAIAEGATHVVVLRSRPDGQDVTGKTSFFEKLIVRRFFTRKNKLKHIFKYMRKHFHKKLYAEQIIELNEATHDFKRDYNDASKPHMMPIAVGPESPEVPKLETRREKIFDGVRRGFARTYDALVEDTAERGRGAIIANEFFPDEILQYNPLDIHSETESAFSVYLNEQQKDSNGWGKTALERGLPR